MRVADEARLLERRRSDRHTGASGAEHHREIFVREGDLVGVHAIVRHKRPSRATLVDAVQPIARSQLPEHIDSGKNSIRTTQRGSSLMEPICSAIPSSRSRRRSNGSKAFVPVRASSQRTTGRAAAIGARSFHLRTGSSPSRSATCADMVRPPSIRWWRSARRFATPPTTGCAQQRCCRRRTPSSALGSDLFATAAKFLTSQHPDYPLGLSPLLLPRTVTTIVPMETLLVLYTDGVTEHECRARRFVTDRERDRRTHTPRSFQSRRRGDPHRVDSLYHEPSAHTLSASIVVDGRLRERGISERARFIGIAHDDPTRRVVAFGEVVQQ